MLEPHPLRVDQAPVKKLNRAAKNAERLVELKIELVDLDSDADRIRCVTDLLEQTAQRAASPGHGLAAQELSQAVQADAAPDGLPGLACKADVQLFVHHRAESFIATTKARSGAATRKARDITAQKTT